MAVQEEMIHNFTGNYVAFYRPRARDYFILQYNQHRGGWNGTRIFLDGQVLQIYFSRVSTRGKCYINIKPTPRGQTKRLDVISNGEYLEYLPIVVPEAPPPVPTRIPILYPDLRVAGTTYSKIPNSLHKPSYPAVRAAADNFETDHRLWHLQVIPAPQAQVPQVQRGGPPMNHRPQPQSIQITLEPIPRRIAWLVAAEAEKQGEQCPITFDEISPLTATVTTCFHCFEADALRAWHETRGGDLECPMCKKKCLTTKAYLEEPLTDRPGE